MESEGVNSGRRRFLTLTTAVVGGVGAIAVAVPFLRSWQPSAKAQAAGAPVEVDISRLQPGQRVEVAWRGQPVWVVRRTPQLLEGLNAQRDRLRDPDSAEEQQPGYARNEFRSLKDEYLVLVGICTHLGCSPLFVPEVQPQAFDQEWQGGFFCPCHASRFDMAGRVFQGVPAPTNLRVPPHRYIDDGRILIGEDTGGAV